MSIVFIQPYAVKPNRILDKKDKFYHINYARWGVYSCMGTKHQEHMRRLVTNTNFYAPNRQWAMEEDLEGFLRDATGQNTTRVKTEFNMIQIMGNQYIGNANRMSINSRATSFSPLSKTRRDEKLAEMMYWTDVANKSNQQYGDHLRQKLPIGKTPEETSKIFENLYVDNYVKDMNGLLRYTEAVNRFDSRRKTIAESLIISGMGIMKPVISGVEWKYKQVWPDRFFFDRAALEYDLADANYMGEWSFMMPTDIYEQSPKIGLDEIKRIENYVSTQSYAIQGRVYVYTVYWRDLIVSKYAYVKDEFGNISLQKVDYDDELGNKSKYAMKDVVDCSKLNDYQKSVIGKSSGKAFKTVYADQWRFCKFIPQELMAGVGYQGTGDIALDYGVVPFQEPNVYSVDNMMPPYMVNFYMYLFGDVYSPIDIAINPQRMANRVMSAMENIINNSRGEGTAYFADHVENEEEALNNMKNSQPVALKFKGLPIQNVIGGYGATMSQGAASLATIAQTFLQSIETITGVNSAMKGQQENADQLVGVMQLMIKRGTVTQERFYDAVQEIFGRCYQNACTAGKRFYIQNKKLLIDAVGDDAANVIELSDGLNNEDFRVTVKRSLSPEDERKSVDALILQFLQGGLLDRGRATNLLGRGTEDDMWQAIREFGREAEEMEKAQQRQAEMMQQQAQAQQQQQQDQMMGMAMDAQAQEAEQKNADREVKLAGEIMKAGAKQQQGTWHEKLQ